jgi:hypothetical protein
MIGYRPDVFDDLEHFPISVRHRLREVHGPTDNAALLANDRLLAA